jgi:hypothetical protein
MIQRMHCIAITVCCVTVGRRQIKAERFRMFIVNTTLVK